MHGSTNEETISLLEEKIAKQKRHIADLKEELEKLRQDTENDVADKTPFDVPMAREEDDEFAMLINAERTALMEAGAYDELRCVLKEEEIEDASVDLETLQEEAAELLGLDLEEYIEQTS